MIKFLGHTMEVIDGKYYFNGEYVCDESCLMTGVNKPNFETYLEQEDFLKNVYKLMTTKKVEK